jgi:hypothetical protein
MPPNFYCNERADCPLVSIEGRLRRVVDPFRYAVSS